MNPRVRIPLIAILLALVLWPTPSPPARRDVPPAGERVLRAALGPLQGVLVPALWASMFEAQAHHRPERALALGRQLLFLRPDETAFWNDLVRWLAFTAPVPALEARPPRMAEALRHVLAALDLAEEGLRQRADPERFELFALVLLRLQTDEGPYGALGEAYADAAGRTPVATLLRVGSSLPAPLDPAIHAHLARAWRARARGHLTVGRRLSGAAAAWRALAHGVAGRLAGSGELAELFVRAAVDPWLARIHAQAVPPERR